MSYSGPGAIIYTRTPHVLISINFTSKLSREAAEQTIPHDPLNGNSIPALSTGCAQGRPIDNFLASTAVGEVMYEQAQDTMSKILESSVTNGNSRIVKLLVKTCFTCMCVMLLTLQDLNSVLFCRNSLLPRCSLSTLGGSWRQEWTRDALKACTWRSGHHHPCPVILA